MQNNPLLFVDPSGNIPSPLEAAYLAQAIYSVTGDDLGNQTVEGGWILIDIHTNDEGLKIGVYSRFQYGVIEYTLVNKGTSTNGDSVNNLQQPVGFSTDMKDSIEFAKIQY
ncbi:hypothetical protein RB620_23450 [Paenibacillus sp. LHD-117]|uniref:hypothetical protein n=1 Tax=Paenibacillus sp. LHD-117 TaxID=3071412 RepID=UPI0027DF298C|nr:hypothetical protein [Paenibacillus sp. LHD-117]MDQ6422391.1 hypothetical protein [Paenibacillus sp. LHD-117]